MRATTRVRGTNGREPIFRSRQRVMRLKARAAVLVVLAALAAGGAAAARPPTPAQKAAIMAAFRSEQGDVAVQKVLVSSADPGYASIGWGFDAGGMSALHDSVLGLTGGAWKVLWTRDKAGARRRRLRLRAGRRRARPAERALPAAREAAGPAGGEERAEADHAAASATATSRRTPGPRPASRTSASPAPMRPGRGRSPSSIPAPGSTSSSATTGSTGRPGSSRCSSRAPARRRSCCSRWRPASASTRPITTRSLARLAVVAALALSAGTASVSNGARAAGTCAPPRASAPSTARITSALLSRTDLWGERLLRAPDGPTLAGASRHLAPLLYARTAKGRPLTASGVYYLPFAEPGGPLGAGTVNLHVADGSEIVSRPRRRPCAAASRSPASATAPASRGSRRPAWPTAGCRSCRRATAGTGRSRSPRGSRRPRRS